LAPSIPSAPSSVSLISSSRPVSLPIRLRTASPFVTACLPSHPTPYREYASQATNARRLAEAGGGDADSTRKGCRRGVRCCEPFGVHCPTPTSASAGGPLKAIRSHQGQGYIRPGSRQLSDAIVDLVEPSFAASWLLSPLQLLFLFIVYSHNMLLDRPRMKIGENLWHLHSPLLA
jgi:hypothetical protein